MSMRQTMVSGTYGDKRWDKQKELNSGMTITAQEPDTLTQTLNGLGDETNAY